MIEKDKICCSSLKQDNKSAALLQLHQTPMLVKNNWCSIAIL